MNDRNAIRGQVHRLLAAYKAGRLGGEKMPEDENPHLDPVRVMQTDDETLRRILVQYRVALQPNRHPAVWKTLCRTFAEQFGGDVRVFLRQSHFRAAEVKAYIAAHKKDFPCLGGTKICNYWLHVLEAYTDCRFSDRENISIAPDTHVLQASARLGVLTEDELHGGSAQTLAANRWDALLEDTGLLPTDLHTPLWLWSRGGFTADINDEPQQAQKGNHHGK